MSVGVTGTVKTKKNGGSAWSRNASKLTPKTEWINQTIKGIIELNVKIAKSKHSDFQIMFYKFYNWA